MHEFGACPVDEYNGEYKGIKIKVYDTVGFAGSSNCSILSNIARRGKFDLILICTKLGDRVDCTMFLELASVLHEEMWKRTVVVLTQANRFITLESVKSGDSEAAIEEKICECKAFIVANLSHRVKKEILQEIPVCIAGEDKKVKLPTADDWLKVLWATLVIRASVEAYLFLHLFAMSFVLLVFVGSVGVGAAAGAVIGGTVGSIVPVFGTVIGVGVGGLVGGVAGGIYSLGKFFNW
uniref:AIG1-type G domain-containing protein n=1 Tax=Amphimedon queenslandica TaxID=400682 RepID=A0A1X7SZ95_AMPQE